MAESAVLIYRLGALMLLATALLFALVLTASAAVEGSDADVEQGAREVAVDFSSLVNDAAFYLPGGAGSAWTATAADMKRYYELFNLTTSTDDEGVSAASVDAPELDEEPQTEENSVVAAVDESAFYLPGGIGSSRIRGKRAARRSRSIIRSPWWFNFGGGSSSNDGDDDDVTTDSLVETAAVTDGGGSSLPDKAEDQMELCICMAQWDPVCAVASNVTFSNMCFYSCADEHDTKDGFMPGECNAASSNGSQTEIDDNGDNENAAPWWCFWCSLEIELPAIFTFSRQQQR